MQRAFKLRSLFCLVYIESADVLACIKLDSKKRLLKHMINSRNLHLHTEITLYSVVFNVAAENGYNHTLY